MGLRDLVDGFTNAAQSVVQPAASVLSGAIAQPISGLAGLFTGNADNVGAVQNALTYQPNTQAGRDGLSALQRAIGQAKTTLIDNNPPVANAIGAYKSAQDWIGERSPVAGAAMAALPTAAMLFAGPGGSVARSAVGSVARDAATGIGDAASAAYANAGAVPAMLSAITRTRREANRTL